MRLIMISGQREVLEGLLNVQGLHLSEFSATDQGNGIWSVSGYANNEAMASLQSLNCTVTDIMTAEEVHAAIESGRGRNSNS